MYPMVKAIMLDYSMKSAIICLQSRREKADSHTRLQFHLIQLQRVVRVVVFGELLENPRLIPKLIPVRFQEQRQTRTARSEYGEPSLCIRGGWAADGLGSGTLAIPFRKARSSSSVKCPGVDVSKQTPE